MLYECSKCGKDVEASDINELGICSECADEENICVTVSADGILNNLTKDEKITFFRLADKANS